MCVEVSDIFPGFTKLHMGLVVLEKKMSVLINFLLQNTNFWQFLAKSSQILLIVISDRTDEFRELCICRILKICSKQVQTVYTEVRVMVFHTTFTNISVISSAGPWLFHL